MKIVHFKKQNVEKIGIKTNQGILDVRRAAKVLNESSVNSMDEIFNDPQNSLAQLKNLQQKVVEKKLSNVYINEDNIYFLPIITNPDKIITVNYNYVLHASEKIESIPTVLSFGSKFKNSLAAHNQNIPLPTFAEKYDFGAELVVVIGKKAKNVTVENALTHIMGYSIGNDLSARDLQDASQNQLTGKTLDYFAPIGPYLVTKDEVDPNELDISLALNGEIHQKNNTKNMLFSCSEIVSTLSQYMTLVPGDLIFTGTPEGVLETSSDFSPSKWISSGDTIDISISDLGTLTNNFF
ncbi:fumarylacetoacetate hydrolase family protein [Desemzia sp. RIT804]|uniref:fumarylacetoacetate hydrolase family protein n=1 Tax=Desemzia sp. RIT 804 TaxID=2810209 RepID=UPI00195096B9|nr:fumarylacetoacetate hydrolase family protein [Desemzia sp. RIT 804]MBM6615726.1 fumarylacetoacetate hydrolase family protein [Desemzia sp. RIT 804]